MSDQAAVERLGNALPAAPQQMPLRLQLVQSLVKAGRGSDALLLAESILRDGGGQHAAMGHYARAVVLHALERHEAAIDDLERAQAINPGGRDGLFILPAVYLAAGRFEQAREAAQRSVAAHPQRGENHWNLALTSLLLGDMQTGWPAFQWRLHTPPLGHLAPPPGKTLWEGQDLASRTILLYCEGGFGDAIQFVRYVPEVARLAGKVILTAPPELLALFGGVTATQLLPQGGPIPECDLVSPLQSLPLNFRTTLETIPAGVPYLRADPQRSRAWRARMTGSGLKVGIAWCGSAGSEQRTRDLQSFAPLAAVAGVTFYSLQKGAEAWQSLVAPEAMDWVDLTAEAQDFADIAAMIDNLDLVISVDTSIPHLAGAMGKPVWTLVPFVPDFRWLIEREDSPWYPTMTLFRQRKPRDWDEVFGRVADELAAFATARA